MTRSIDKPRTVIVAALLAVMTLVTATGCAFVDQEWPMWWQDAVVVRTMHRAELPSGIDAGCVPAAPSSGATPDAALFALVQFRVGRAPYPMLFPIDDDSLMRPGDRVSVEPGTCKLRARVLVGSGS